MWPLLLSLAAAAPADLAPTPRDVREALATQERLLGRSSALGAATARLHNAAARRMAAGEDCREPELRSLLTRAQRLGEAWREALQSARALQPVLEERAAAPTVAPLLPPSLRADITGAGERARRDAARYAEAAAWQRAFAPARCLDPDALAVPSPGLTDPTGREPGAVAVILGPDSALCPSGRTAAGPAVLQPPVACVAPMGAACTCRPEPVAAGAVLIAGEPAEGEPAAERGR